MSVDIDVTFVGLPWGSLIGDLAAQADLAAALAAKAALTHGHDVADINGLQGFVVQRITDANKQDKIQFQLQTGGLSGLGAIDRVNFDGPGITAVVTGTTVTYTVSGGGGASAWGGITGSIANQTDLQAALNAKETAGAVAGHVAAADPHPQYLTATEGDAVYATIGAVAGKLNTSAVSAFMLTVLDDVDAATARATLGLGTAATLASTAFAAAAHTHTLANVTDVTMTVANLNTLDDGVDTTLHFHAADRARANHTGTQLAATISDFNTAADARVTAGITGKLNTSAVSAFMLTVLDDVDAATARATLGLGTAATLASTAFAAAAHTHTLANVTDVTMTVANLNTLDDGVDTTLHFHAADRARANHTGTQLAATISDFNTAADARVTAGITGKQGNIQFQDEGVNAGASGGITSINFVGAGVAATAVGGALTVTISGGGGAGTGDVVGPAAAVNNAVARFDTTTGKLIKSSTANLTDAGELELPSVTTPANAAANAVRVLTVDLAGKKFQATMDELGQLWPVYPQPHTANNFISAYGAYNASLLYTMGATFTITGTGTSQGPTTNATAYNNHGMAEALVTVAAATAVAGWRCSTTILTRTHGFFLDCKAGPATGVATATSRFFMGLSNSTAAPTDVEPSSQLNIIGIGYDAADANLQIMHNDGAGVAVKVDLGANFPVPTADRTQVYQLFLYQKPGAATFNYRVVNTNTGQVAVGTINSVDIPALTTQLAWRVYSSVGGTSSVIGVGFRHMVAFQTL